MLFDAWLGRPGYLGLLHVLDSGFLSYISILVFYDVLHLIHLEELTHLLVSNAGLVCLLLVHGLVIDRSRLVRAKVVFDRDYFIACRPWDRQLCRVLDRRFVCTLRCPVPYKILGLSPFIHLYWVELWQSRR